MVKKEVYTVQKRIKSGIKRFIKVTIPLIPQILDLIKGIDIPQKHILTALLVAIVAFEKALQKDKNK